MFTRRTSWTVGLLVIGSLLALSPTTAPAGGAPSAFFAQGLITGIDEGNVTPAGKSGRFVVKERVVTGVLGGSIGGPFQFTFGSNVPLLTQSGQIHGVLLVDGYEASVAASSSLGLTPVPCPDPDGVTCIATPAGNFVPGLVINGTFTFTSGTQGHGTASAWIIPAIDPNTGHIVGVIAGALTLAGQWHQ